MNVDLCFLTYNRLPTVMSCFNSLSFLLGNPDFQFRIVDNASNMRMVEWLINFERSHENVAIYLNSENAGVAGGRKFLFESSMADYVISLDSDVVITSPTFIRDIVESLEDETVGVLGAGGHWLGKNWKAIPVTAGWEGDVHVVSGYCQAFRRGVLKQLVMDLDYNYCGNEDDDLCLQARTLGYRVVHKELPIRHLYSGTWAHGDDYTIARRRLVAKWKDKFMPPVKGMPMEVVHG